MAKEKNEMFLCPVGRFFSDLEKASFEKSNFLKHLKQSRIEFLKAVRSLIDEKIESLEEKESPRAKKKMTKISVE